MPLYRFDSYSGQHLIGLEPIFPEPKSVILPIELKMLFFIIPLDPLFCLSLPPLRGGKEMRSTRGSNIAFLDLWSIPCLKDTEFFFPLLMNG